MPDVARPLPAATTTFAMAKSQTAPLSQPNLSFVINATPTQAPPGAVVTFAYTAWHKSFMAADIHATGLLPPGLRFISGDTGVTHDSRLGVVTWEQAQVPPEEEVSASFQAQVVTCSTTYQACTGFCLCLRCREERLARLETGNSSAGVWSTPFEVTYSGAGRRVRRHSPLAQTGCRTNRRASRR